MIKVTFKELEDMKFASVTDYCRMLMEEGYEANTIVEVYRGDMLCLTVSSIKEGAKLEPADVGFRNHRLDKYKKVDQKLSKPRTEV